MTITDERGRAEVGAPRRRKEDARLITGRTTWTDNLTLPGMLHLAILRSPFAHARIVRVDTAPALAEPGVIAAFSGRDVADTQGSLPCAWPVTADMTHPDHPPIAVDEVRHCGEAVAVVVARSRAAAVDALAAIDVDYDELPVVLDLAEAVADNTRLAHSGGTGNTAYTWVFDSAEAGTGGPVDAAIERAEVLIRRRFRQQRLIPAFMEPRSVVVDPTGDQHVMWSATQVPHILRLMLALSTGVPEHKVRVIAPDVGGGFGGKLQVTPEELITFLAAIRLATPVKYTETRSDSMVSAHHGRDMIQDLELAARRDGTVLGLRVRLLANMGAYLGLVGPGVPLLGAFMYNGIYKFPAYRFECTGVFTNTTFTDAYRGAGRPEATYAIERLMDELAVEVGLDPIEVRRRNWIDAGEFPFATVAGLTYDSGDYAAATDRATDLFRYDDLRAEQRRRRDGGDVVQLGIGVSTYTEMCGLAPSKVLGSLRYGAGGWEAASVRVLPTGKIEVVTGTSPHGQGHETAWSQIVADRLGVPFEDVEVLHGDTRTSPKGMDTYGSRSLAVGGAALYLACQRVIEKATPVAARLCGCDPADIEFVAGRFRIRPDRAGAGDDRAGAGDDRAGAGDDRAGAGDAEVGAGDAEVGCSLADCALAVFAAHDLPDGMEPNLDADAVYDPANFSFPHGTHLCAVEVDTHTGRVSIRSYVAVDDVGRVVNPMIVEGQVHGGVAQGIAQALFEEAVYDTEGTLRTGTFVDYTLPTAADLPDLITDRTETPAPDHPLGAKGAGEAGTIASTPAVVNAVVDALRPYGVRDVPMPCTPERVWQALRDARGAA